MKSDTTPERQLRIFLCHSSADKSAVRSLYQRLCDDGFAPWLDEEDLLPGQDWQQEVPKAVSNSDVVIVCLSKAAINKRGYVQKEIRYALDVAEEQPEGVIFLIPLRLEECDVPDRLSRWHWVSLYEKKGYSRLVLALKARAKRVLSEDDSASPAQQYSQPTRSQLPIVESVIGPGSEEALVDKSPEARAGGEGLLSHITEIQAGRQQGREVLAERGQDAEQKQALDFETHYSLGLAYKGMELLDDAVEQFQLAARLAGVEDSEGSYTQCCHMLGVCFRQKGMHKLATMWFQRGLKLSNRSEEAYRALVYEMAVCYEEMGDLRKALDSYMEVYGADVHYRNVSEKIKRLQVGEN